MKTIKMMAKMQHFQSFDDEQFLMNNKDTNVNTQGVPITYNVTAAECHVV